MLIGITVRPIFKTHPCGDTNGGGQIVEKIYQFVFLNIGQILIKLAPIESSQSRISIGTSFCQNRNNIKKVMGRKEIESVKNMSVCFVHNFLNIARIPILTKPARIESSRTGLRPAFVKIGAVLRKLWIKQFCEKYWIFCCHIETSTLGHFSRFHCVLLVEN